MHARVQISMRMQSTIQIILRMRSTETVVNMNSTSSDSLEVATDHPYSLKDDVTYQIPLIINETIQMPSRIGLQ